MNRASIISLIKKIHKGTGGTGMKDDIPASIDGVQPAALSAGEYVWDAETVALLGDGNSEAGARILDQLRQEIRKIKGKRLVKGKQGKSWS